MAKLVKIDVEVKEIDVLLGIVEGEFDRGVKGVHAMDGYTDKEINEMAKNKPEIRGQWARYKEQQAKYHDLSGKERKVSFDGLM